MYIERTIEKKIKKFLFSGQVIIVYGPRQVGKTMLVKHLLTSFSLSERRYFNLDEGDIFRKFEEADTSTALKQIVGNVKIAVIDEAQRIKDIGLKLKLISDTFPQLQILVTGSSSFDIADKVSEPLTGRAIEFYLNPFSLKEIKAFKDEIEIGRELNDLLIYGSYPKIVLAETIEKKELYLRNIEEKYLFKDILKHEGVKAPGIVRKLLTALALQVGSTVSYSELANLLGYRKETIGRYIDVLEKSFVIFTLGSYSKNLRQELNRGKKIYFYDNGIRNALINNLNDLSLRDDVGKLWENFVISEKMKSNFWQAQKSNYYFWRTYEGQEVDLLEEKSGKIFGYEAKWRGGTRGPSKMWGEAYPKASWEEINRENFISKLG